MKNAYLLGILAVCLTACGGGGSGGNSNSSNVASPPINSQTDGNTSSNTSKQGNNSSSNIRNIEDTSAKAQNNGTTSNDNTTVGNNTQQDSNSSSNVQNIEDTSAKAQNNGTTSDDNTTVGNNSEQNSNSSGNIPKTNNTSGNNSSDGNTNNVNQATLKNTPLEIENIQTKRYINQTIEYGNLKLAQDNQYLTPKTGEQNTAETFKVKPMTENQKQSVQEIVDYTNKLRKDVGLPELVLDNKLTAFAQRRAEELAGRYAHERPDNSSIFVQGLQGGGGENIAAGHKTALDVSKGWENSPGHYANMIGKEFTKIGIGVVSVPGSRSTYQWVQIFGFEDTTTPYYFDENPASAQTKLSDATAKLIGSIPAMNWISLENGKSIYIADIPSNGEWHHLKSITDTNTYNSVLNGYDDVRFGALKEQGGKYQVFYRGNNTIFEEIPSSGTINYAGKAFMTDGNSNAFLKAAFQADFSNKKLDGVLSQDGNDVLDIHAVIRGSSFHSNPEAQVETQGSFFGPKAAELGGVFYDHNSNQYGSYGAKQK